jgi:plasmid stability protein
MPNVMVRNIPTELYKRLQERARSRRRSLNAEILAILSDDDGWALRRLETAAAIPRLRRIRERLARKYPNQPDSVDLIREDRDGR